VSGRKPDLARGRGVRPNNADDPRALQSAAFTQNKKKHGFKMIKRTTEESAMASALSNKEVGIDSTELN